MLRNIIENKHLTPV